MFAPSRSQQSRGHLSSRQQSPRQKSGCQHPRRLPFTAPLARAAPVAAIACAITAAASITAPAAHAQQPIELEIGASWTHPHSGIIVPDTLGGLPRGEATEFAPDFLNLGFSFRADEPYEELSLYIYRHTNAGLPVWFEQSRNAIAVRDAYAGASLAFGAEPFGWPGAESWQGLRAVYDMPEGSQISSTAVALFSVDGWFVKMRASSQNRSPEQLRDLMNEAFAELTPPEAQFAQAPAVPVKDCAAKLEFKKKAKDAKKDPGAALIGALLGGMALEEVQEEQAGDTAPPPPPPTWCRDGSLSAMQVAYRADASLDSYIIALNDSGIGVSVGVDLGAQLLMDDKAKSKKQSFSISVITDSQRINYVPQNRLPSFERVLEIINANRRVSAVSTWGDTDEVEISSDAL